MMAVSAIILEPQNEFEQHFSVPVAAQDVFEKYWIPAIASIDTVWIGNIQYGIDVTKEDAACVLEELALLKDWARKNLQDAVLAQMIARITLLEVKLPTAFQRSNAVVFIG